MHQPAGCLRGWLVAAVALAVTAACSSTGGAASSGPDGIRTASPARTAATRTPTGQAALDDPCTLLTAEEVSGAVGSTATPPSTSGTITSGWRCEYPLADGKTVMIQTRSQFVDFDFVKASAAEHTGQVRTLPELGLGDNGLWSVTDEVWMRAGGIDTAVSIGLGDGWSADGEQARQIAVARRVAPKLVSAGPAHQANTAGDGK